MFFHSPATSLVKICWAGPNNAFSNVGKAAGVPSHTNLINADTLSKQY